tara:strand:+ start:42133 stop:42828 length:696 start_codon:yes stop_codon:yes gene_type:complete
MVAAITLFSVLTISVMFIRFAAMALRLTGLPEDVARFQARSAFTGAGFTTSESETVVNHPLRRRIMSMLMLVGNLGLVTVLATVIVSLVDTVESDKNMISQLGWLVGMLVLLWVIALNPMADRIMCAGVSWLLNRHSAFSDAVPHLLLQMPAGHNVSEMRVGADLGDGGSALSDILEPGIRVLGIRRIDGSYENLPGPDMLLQPLDDLLVYGPGSAYGAMSDKLHALTAHE